MLAATKVKMSGSDKKKSEQEHKQHFLHKTCSWKFLEVSRCSRAEQRQRNVQKIGQNCFFSNQKKSVLHVQSFFLLIRPTDFFWLFSLPLPLGVTLFYILFSKLQILTRASLLALAKSIYYLRLANLPECLYCR